MDAEEMGRSRYRFHATRIWTPTADTRFIRKVLAAFPNAYEIDKDGNPVPLEQLTLDG